MKNKMYGAKHKLWQLAQYFGLKLRITNHHVLLRSTSLEIQKKPYL